VNVPHRRSERASRLWFQSQCESQQPGEYHPITVASIIARLFHRVLAMRLEDEIPLSPGQKAFRRGD